MADEYRVFNFSAGPSVLPEPVLRKCAAEMLNYEGTGESVMEMSHRSPEFQKIIDDAERDYYTGSQVFIKNFILYAQSFEDDAFPITITVAEGKSKTGKKYYTIEEAPSTSSNWREIKF